MNEELNEETVSNENVANGTNASAQTVTVNAGQSANPVKQKKGNAVASLVLGICSIVCCSIGGILGIIGLINGIVGVKKKQKKGLAVTGIILSSIGILLGILVLAGSIIGFILFGSSFITLIKIAQSPAIESAGEIISNVDLNEIDPNNIEDSIKEQVMQSATEAIINSINDKISSADGITITDPNGNDYTIQGDSLSEATIYDETTGEEINVGDYIDAIQNGKEDFMTSLEEEYGITEDELSEVMSEMAGEAGVNVDPETIELFLELMEME